MGKVIVTVELADNNYAAYIKSLPGCVTTAKTFEELKRNIAEAVEFHLDGMREDGEEIPSDFSGGYEFVFQFDTESLLLHYKGIFTNSALERLTGINQRQLQHYASGMRKPRLEQAKKIQDALHDLGRELLVVEL